MQITETQLQATQNHSHLHAGYHKTEHGKPAIYGGQPSRIS